MKGSSKDFEALEGGGLEDEPPLFRGDVFRGRFPSLEVDGERPLEPSLGFPGLFVAGAIGMISLRLT
jgi:hypothetical protein